MGDEAARSNQDHDQRFKTAVKEFFAEFLDLALPHWHGRVDFTKVEWLDKESYPAPPDGERGVMDLVAKVPLRQAENEEWRWIIVLTEIDSRSSLTALRAQIERYYVYLRSHHSLKVMPIALLLNVGLDGIGWETCYDTDDEDWVQMLRFRYIGLPALEAAEYVTGSNSFAVALTALMRLQTERRAWLKAAALQRIGETEKSPGRRFLLSEIVDTYLKLDEREEAELRNMLREPQYEEARQMTTTWFQAGKAEGKAEGQLEQTRLLLLRLGTKRFGEPSTVVRETIEALHDPSRLEQLVDRVLDATDWDDLVAE